MSTKARLGIDITATNKTAAAFASVQKNVSSIQKSVQSLKFLMAGFVSGQFLEGMMRSFVEVAKQTLPVKTAIDNLGIAWFGFAQKVGQSGLNEALINFANRMGAMILSTDGIATSIGRFMGGAINVMARTFEGIGRAIAFAYDNAEIFGRLLASMAMIVAAKQVMALAAGFYFFAKTVRQTGIIMTAFNAISRANLLIFLALAAGIAYATDSVDRLKSGIDMMWTKVKEVFPMIADAGGKMAESFGFDLSALSDDLANMTKYLNNLSGIEMPALALSKSQKERQSTIDDIYGTGKAVQSLQATFQDAQWGAGAFSDSLFQIGDTIKSSVGSAISGLITGTTSVKDAFASMAQSIIQTMADMAAQLAISAGFRLLMSMLGGGGGAGFNMGGMVFGGLFAKGGTLGAGQWGIAGEAGPEIIHGPAKITPMSSVPRSSSLDKMGGGQMNVTVINNTPARVNTSRGADGGLNIEIVQEVLANALSRGGNKIDEAMARGYGLRRAGR
jgi:hypothetical protein